MSAKKFKAPLPRILGQEIALDSNGEFVLSNNRSGRAVLSICVPTYRDDATPLIARLAELPGAEHCTLVVYDDGSGDHEMTGHHADSIQSFPGPARLVTCIDNYGRSHARNRLVARAEADWVLLLDADMLPDNDDFLTLYLNQIDANVSKGLVAGGFSLQQVTPGPRQKLHFAQARKSDCVTAAERSTEPGRYVFTSNILVHKDVLSAVGFDENFTGWGWEDVDWGLRVAEHFPILHIDNTATHLGLEPDETLIGKFGASGGNYGRLVEKHPSATEHLPLTRAARHMKPLAFLRAPMKATALSRWLPVPVRLTALKFYRAIAYSRYV